MADVSIKGLNKSYGPLQILDDIDLDIRDGEFVVLVGPSGCGKSTMLRIIAGLDAASGGDIHIGERLVNEVAPRGRDIAMVFQSYALYPHMNVRKNLSFGLRIRGGEGAEIERRVDEASRILGLDAMMDRLPKQLSGGQRQRVAMGRAIVRDPAVFLFDEPLSNLDAKLRVQMRKEIKEMHRRLSATAIYVTHDQIEAMTMADRVVVMRGGVIEQIGAPLELYDRPENLFVAGFIGAPAMNLFEGRITRDTEGTAVDLGAARLPLGAGPELPSQGEVVLGIRPEHLEIVAREGAPLTARVEVIEPTGSETLVDCRLGEHSLQVAVRDRVALVPGDTVGLRPQPGKLHLFDKASEERMPL